MKNDDFKDKNNPDIELDEASKSDLDGDKNLDGFSADDKAVDKFDPDHKAEDKFDSDNKTIDKFDSSQDKTFGKSDDLSDSIDESKSDESEAVAEEEELPTKSQTEIELERVESIESMPLAEKETETSSDLAKSSDLAAEIDSALAETDQSKADSSQPPSKSDKPADDSKLKANQLPVSHPEDNKKKVSLDDIIKNQKTEKQAAKKPLIWIILTLVFFLAAVSVGALYYLSLDEHGRQQAKLQTELDSQKATQAAMQKQLQAAKASLEEQTESAAETVSTRTVPEWGVQYPYDQTTAELTYSYSVYAVGATKVSRLSFSTAKISAIEDKSGQAVSYPCSSSTAPTGWIDRFSETELNAVKQLVKDTPMADSYEAAVKNGDYYYLSGTPQNACSDQLNQTNYAEVLKVVQSLPEKFTAVQ